MQEVRGNRDLVKKINPYLPEVKIRIITCYQQLVAQHSPITAETLKSIVVGEKKLYSTLLFLMLYHKASGETILKPGTLKNYGATEKYVWTFLSEPFCFEDIPLCYINYQFITQHLLFLRTTTTLEESNTLGNNRVMKHMERLRKIVTMGVKLEWIPKDPFILYKHKFHRTEKEFLPEHDIKKLEKATQSNDSPFKPASFTTGMRARLNDSRYDS